MEKPCIGLSFFLKNTMYVFGSSPRPTIEVVVLFVVALLLAAVVHADMAFLKDQLVPETRMRKECFNVPQTVSKTCSMSFPQQEQENCAKVVPETNCQVKNRRAPSICHRLVEAERQHDCPKKVTHKMCEEVLISTPSMCSKEVVVAQAVPCMKSVSDNVCHQQPDTAPSTCFRSVAYDQPYKCWQMESQLQCEPAPPCPVTPPTCRMVKVVKPSMCEREVRSVENRPCRLPAEEEECRGFVEVPCKEDEVYYHLCLKSNHENVCKGRVRMCNEDCGKRKQPGVCPEEVVRLEKYPCPMEKEEEQCDQPPTDCGTRPEQKRCRTITEPFEATCTAMLLKAEEYKCPRNVMRRVCEDRETKEVGQCYESKKKVVEFPCHIKESKEQCVTVTDFKMGSCTIKVSEVEDYDCDKLEIYEDCQVVQRTRMRSCYHDAMVNEEYECYDKTYEEKCIEFPEKIADTQQKK
eukprot:GHVS01086255.1.p1 GENE.GHVS01086255.1~~GHVS01086255.1.p1  ORF type:complete len:464 (-),score=75.49 GHVS01086255.1:1214-2605(-)